MSERKPTIAELEAIMDDGAARAISILPDGQIRAIECHRLDTPTQVLFYENDFYVLSNFSAFTLRWKGTLFYTSEHAYQAEKFRGITTGAFLDVSTAPSAHEAFKIAEALRTLRHPRWDEMKIDVMRLILREKVRQHEYVRDKLLATGDRELIEDSWRDDFWGWGPNRDGQNMLGKLWMEIRAELRPPVTPLAEALDSPAPEKRRAGT